MEGTDRWGASPSLRLDETQGVNEVVQGLMCMRVHVRAASVLGVPRSAQDGLIAQPLQLRVQAPFLLERRRDPSVTLSGVCPTLRFTRDSG